MKIRSAFRVSVLGVVAVLPAIIGANRVQAALIVADGFDYSTGTNALASDSDTDFSSNPAAWALTGTANQGPNIVSGSLTYSGPGAIANLPGSNSAQVNTGGGADRIQLATPASGGLYSDSATPGTTLYYSFTMSVTSITALTTSGSFVSGFNNLTGTNGTEVSSDYGDVCIRKNGTSFQLGVAQTQAPSTNRIFSSNNYSTGDVLFVAIAYNIGTTTGTDTAELYVSDGGAGNTIPLTQPLTPTVASPWAADITGSIESFFLRDNASSATATIDDVRVGTTWNAITGQADAVPEPASLSALALAAPVLLKRRRSQNA